MLSPSNEEEANPERVAQENSPAEKWKLCEFPVHVARPPPPYVDAVTRPDDVRLPPFAVVKKRLVELAVPENRLVLVLFVVVL